MTRPTALRLSATHSHSGRLYENAASLLITSDRRGVRFITSDRDGQPGSTFEVADDDLASLRGLLRSDRIVSVSTHASPWDAAIGMGDYAMRQSRCINAAVSETVRDLEQAVRTDPELVRALFQEIAAHHELADLLPSREKNSAKLVESPEALARQRQKKEWSTDPARYAATAYRPSLSKTYEKKDTPWAPFSAFADGTVQTHANPVIEEGVDELGATLREMFDRDVEQRLLGVHSKEATAKPPKKAKPIDPKILAAADAMPDIPAEPRFGQW